ncbi:MAG: hypothetical protein ACFFFG_12755 [Candidatus Thorarchaeota archaeon]
MSKMRDRKWRLLQLLVERLPQFVPHYDGAHQQYVADFINLLQHVDVRVPSTRNQFVTAASIYLEKYCTQTTGRWISEYQTLPFLWFVHIFLERAIDLIEVKDNFHQFLQLCYGVLHGNDENNGVFTFLRQNFALSDNRWEELQFHAYEYQRPLSTDELGMVRILYSVLPHLKYTDLSIPTMKGIFRQHGASLKQIKSIADFCKRQGLFFRLNVNWRRVGVDEFEIILKTPLDTEFKDIFDFTDPANSILTESRIYMPWQQSAEEKTFLGFLRIPLGHERALSSFLTEKKMRGLVRCFSLEKVEESMLTYSLGTYTSQVGFKEFRTQEIWQSLGELMDGKGQPAESLNEIPSDSGFFVVRYPSGERISLTHEFIHLRNVIGKQISISGLPPSLTTHDQSLLDELQQKGGLILYMSLANMVNTIALSAFQYLKLPHLPADQLKILLNFAPQSSIYRTANGVSVFTRVPPPVAKVFHTPGWAPNRQSSIFEVVMAHQPSFVSPRSLDVVQQRWITPIVFQEYLEDF